MAEGSELSMESAIQGLLSEEAPEGGEIESAAEELVEPEELEEAAEAVTEDSDPVEEQPIAEDETEEDDPETIIDPPASWTAEEKEAFKTLSPDVQQTLAARDRERTADIRRRQNELAEEKKALEAQKAQIEAMREQYLESVTKDQPEPPDPELINTDPVEYLKQKAAYEQQLQTLQAAQKERQEAERKRQEEAQTRYDSWMKDEAEKLQTMLPAMSGEQGAALKAKVADFAMQSGYSQQELQYASARDIKILHDAMMFRQGRTAAEKAKTAPKPKVSKPGAARTKAEHEADQRKAAFARLNKSGRMEDALDLLME